MYGCTLHPMTTRDAQERLTQEEKEIVVDWSQALAKQPDADIERMIAWIRTYPNTRNIHVFLGARKHKPAGRRLQNSLQALGCSVTNRAIIYNEQSTFGLEVGHFCPGSFSQQYTGA